MADAVGWTWPRAVRPATRVVLACFPHAGGGAAAFRDWELALPRDVAVAAWTPPGREGRFFEKLQPDLGGLVDDALDGLPAPGLPLALYGHSMGALIALEIAQRLVEADRPPALLVAAGHSAPGTPDTAPRRSTLPDPEFVDELRRLGGTPEEVLDRPELLDLLLPVLRSDFAAAEAHVPRTAPVLPCPLLVLGGRRDAGVPPASLDGWSGATTASVTVRLLPGDHFFVRSSQGALLELLAGALRDAAPVAA